MYNRGELRTCKPHPHKKELTSPGPAPKGCLGLSCLMNWDVGHIQGRIKNKAPNLACYVEKTGVSRPLARVLTGPTHAYMVN
jgi:hypothetical protein